MMKVYTKNLYESIFGEICTSYTRLRIISGYASAAFLSRIMNDFPNLKIELFLGMTSQGLPINDHLEFQHCMQSKNINVYYQIKGKPNHMKILEFSNMEDKKTFIGSANFSENGFFHHKEVLVEVKVNSSFDVLFEDQLNDSILCTDDRVNDLIIFHGNTLEEETFKSNQGELNSEDIEITYSMNAAYDTILRDGNNTRYFKKRRWEKLRDRMNSNFYNIFEVTVVLPKDSNIFWDRTGINAWVEGKKPVLEQTPKQLFSKVFPDDQEFHIYTDDNKILKAKLAGKFNGELHILNINLFEYVRMRIGLTEKRPICYNDLESSGYTTMYFTRINKYEYFMSFNKVNY